MNLKEFRKIINKIPSIYDKIEISFICNNQEYFVKDIENDIEWYEDDIQNNKKYIDITLKKM